MVRRVLYGAMIEPADGWSYAVLYVGVAASWIGIPVVGSTALAAAGAAGNGTADCVVAPLKRPVSPPR